MNSRYMYLKVKVHTKLLISQNNLFKIKGLKMTIKIENVSKLYSWYKRFLGDIIDQDIKSGLYIDRQSMQDHNKTRH